MPFISKEEYRNIANMQGLSNKNNTVASTSGKNRKKGKGKEKAKGKGKATPNAATSVFSIEAAIEAAIAEANQVIQQQQADEPDASSTKENALPNENLVVDGFPLLGNPRRSFIGNKTTTTSTMMTAMAMPWFAVAAASATAGVAAVDTGDDDEVEDINGVPDITDGNSLESLSPYSKSPCRPSSSGGSSDSSVGQQPTSAMKYSTMSSTTSLYNVMGTKLDATLTPRTLELSAVLDCLSFDFSSQNTTADKVVTGDETATEEDLMPSIINTFSSYSSINENITITTTFEVAQTLYGAVKDVWANGKHIPVICSLFNIAETVAASVLDHITSSSGGVGTKEMVLLDIDERVIKPQIKMLDEKIVSPTITEVFKAIELIVSKADELVIAPIIKGLIFFNRKEKDVLM